jgi:hypothetical protein
VVLGLVVLVCTSVEAGRIAERLRDELGGAVISEEQAVAGMTIPLNSLVVGPSYERADTSDPILTITFRRDDLTEEFVEKFFDPTNRNVRVIHPFAERGIEAVLNNERLSITIHRGVILHLRNDLEAIPGFRTFRINNAVGTVSAVSGDFVVSRDSDTIRHLSHVSTRFSAPQMRCAPDEKCVRTRDGGYLFQFDSSDSSLPRRYPPRVQ